ncbi:MAG: hypothetical protein LBR36_08805 [Bacteroidales bacterium]|jgi:cell division protein FtsB|nr:hypothetical protein [Bacteroidales bacterium]
MRIIAWIIKYKYGLTLLLFAVYMLVGDNNVLEIRRLNKQINLLEKKVQKYNQAAADIRQQNAQYSLQNEEQEEACLRLHYNMKQANEDVFRIVTQDKKEDETFERDHYFQKNK